MLQNELNSIDILEIVFLVFYFLFCCVSFARAAFRALRSHGGPSNFCLESLKGLISDETPETLRR